MNVKGLVKKVGKNALFFLIGGVIGLIAGFLYVTVVWAPEGAGEIGLGIIGVIPVMLVIFCTIGFVLGGALSLILYNIFREKKK